MFIRRISTSSISIIVGDQLVQNSWAKDVKLQFPIVKNDDRAIVFKWQDKLAVIDKILGSLKVYVNGQGAVG